MNWKKEAENELRQYDTSSALSDECYKAITNAAEEILKTVSEIVSEFIEIFETVFETAFEDIAEIAKKYFKITSNFADTVYLTSRRKNPRPNYKYSPKLPNLYIKQIRKSRTREKRC